MSYGYYRKVPHRTKYCVTFKNATRNNCSQFEQYMNEMKDLEKEFEITPERMSQLDKEVDVWYQEKVKEQIERKKKYLKRKREEEMAKSREIKNIEQRLKVLKERKSKKFKQLKEKVREDHEKKKKQKEQQQQQQQQQQNQRQPLQQQRMSGPINMNPMFHPFPGRVLIPQPVTFPSQTQPILINQYSPMAGFQPRMDSNVVMGGIVPTRLSPRVNNFLNSQSPPSQQIQPPPPSQQQSNNNSRMMMKFVEPPPREDQNGNKPPYGMHVNRFSPNHSVPPARRQI